jgi:hypothetical protein
MKKIFRSVLLIGMVGGLVFAYGPGGDDYGKGMDGSKEYRQHEMSGKRHRKIKKGGMSRMIKELDLSTAQLKEIDAYRESNRVQHMEMKKNLKKAQFELKMELVKVNLDHGRINALKDTILRSQRDSLEAHIKAMKHHHSILTVEQKEKSVIMMEKMEKKRLENKLSKSGMFGKKKR